MGTATDDVELLATPPRLEAHDPVLPADAVKDGTAGRILAAALGLFASRGFYGASIRDIAVAAGVRSATLYGHFPSKESILAELVDIGHREHNRRLRAALLGEGSDPAEELCSLVRAHVGFHGECPVLGTVANTELHALSPELAGPAVRHRRESEGLLLRVVIRGLDQGRFETPDAWLSVAAIGGMGIRVASWYSSGSPFSVSEVGDVYAELALRIVGAGEGGR